MSSKNKSKRIIFSDRLILILGIPILAIISILVLGFDQLKGEIQTIAVTLLTTISSTAIMWLGIRHIVIFLWKRYPWEKNPVKHLIIEIAALIGYTALAGAVVAALWYIFDPDSIKQEDIGANIFFTIVITFFITSLHEGYFFFMQWKNTLLKSERLEKENIQSQFETLKSQVNPHFLFNNMNTLTSLIEENPKLAVEYVQRTADYYRSILNQKDKDVIPLEDEIRLIQDYYFLQRERYGSNLSLIVNIPQSLMQTLVAPLTIQMLFENAVKHNIISKDKPLTITISANHQFIVVENNLQHRNSEESSNRIGLQNITNRYRFLSPHQVEISENGNTFTVRIPILTAER